MEPVEGSRPDTVGAEEVQKATAVAKRVEENIRRAVKVRDEVLEHVVVAMLEIGRASCRERV